jgi:hypothetical protein
VRRVQDAAEQGGRLAEVGALPLRWLRDRVLMPLATRGMAGRSAQVMQEPPQRLLALAQGHERTGSRARSLESSPS